MGAAQMPLAYSPYLPASLVSPLLDTSGVQQQQQPPSLPSPQQSHPTSQQQQQQQHLQKRPEVGEARFPAALSHLSVICRVGTKIFSRKCHVKFWYFRFRVKFRFFRFRVKSIFFRFANNFYFAQTGNFVFFITVFAKNKHRIFAKIRPVGIFVPTLNPYPAAVGQRESTVRHSNIFPASKICSILLILLCDKWWGRRGGTILGRSGSYHTHRSNSQLCSNRVLRIRGGTGRMLELFPPKSGCIFYDSHVRKTQISLKFLYIIINQQEALL